MIVALHLDHVEEVGHAGVPEVPPAEVVVVDLVLHQVAGLVGEPRGLQLGPAARVLAWRRPVSDGRHGQDLEATTSYIGEELQRKPYPTSYGILSLTESLCKIYSKRLPYSIF